MNPTFPPPPPVPAPARLNTGLAIASLVLGIFAFLLSFVVVGSILGLIGLVLGLVQIGTRRGPTAMAWWGFALGLVSIVISLAMIPVYIKAYRKVKETI